MGAKRKNTAGFNGYAYFTMTVFQTLRQLWIVYTK
jgi:hypothetical protein